MAQTGTVAIAAGGDTVAVNLPCARHRRTESVSAVRRLVLPLIAVVLAGYAVSAGLTAPPQPSGAPGPAWLAWLPYIAAGALVALAPLLFLFGGLTRPAQGAAEGQAPGALVETLTRRAEEAEALLGVAVAEAERVGAEAATACRQEALIVVRAIARATHVDHPGGSEAVRDFSERLLAAFGYLAPTHDGSAGVPHYPPDTAVAGRSAPPPTPRRSRWR